MGLGAGIGDQTILGAADTGVYGTSYPLGSCSDPNLLLMVSRQVLLTADPTLQARLFIFVCMHVPWLMWRSEDNLQELVLASHHSEGSGPQVVRLGASAFLLSQRLSSNQVKHSLTTLRFYSLSSVSRPEHMLRETKSCVFLVLFPGSMSMKF